MNRTKAFVLAPIPAAALGGIVSWATGGHPRPVSVAVFYLLQFYVLQLLLGLAIYALLRRMGRKSIVSFTGGGVLMVAIVAVPYLVWASSRPENTLVRTSVVLGLWLLLGAITGAMAWLLIQRDKSRSTAE